MFYDIKVSQNSIEIISFLIPSVLFECYRGRVVNECSDSVAFPKSGKATLLGKATNAQTPEFFIALIPLVRNLIEYAKDTSIGTPKSDYLKLTSCLHVKTETTNLTVNDIEQIIRSNIDIRNLPTENTTSNIKDYIYNMADVLCVRPDLDEINIENKIALAIAIRLKAEDYLISKLKLCMPNGDFDLFYNNIESNQTSVLTKKFNELCSSVKSKFFCNNFRKFNIQHISAT